jgi:ribosomal protein S8
MQRKGKKIVIISTSQGVMSGNDAQKKGIGGEILFTIW